MAAEYANIAIQPTVTSVERVTIVRNGSDRWASSCITRTLYPSSASTSQDRGISSHPSLRLRSKVALRRAYETHIVRRMVPVGRGRVALATLRPEDPLSDERRNRQISRRRALKKAAAVGGALWVAPAIQSVNMTKAWAAVGSLTTDECFSVRIDIDHYGNAWFRTVDPRFRCITSGVAGAGPTSLPSVASDGAGGYVVTVPGAEARIVEGFAEWKSGTGEIVGDPCTPGASSAANVVRFSPNVSANGKPARRCDIELTFCLPSVRLQP